MRSPEGQDYWGRGVYREIVEPERIVYLDSCADEEGTPVEPAHYGMSPGHPAETLVTVTFTEHGGTTKVTLHHASPRRFLSARGFSRAGPKCWTGSLTSWRRHNWGACGNRGAGRGGGGLENKPRRAGRVSWRRL